ncbi:MAG: M1 family aminopeptidase [Candidatus Thiodiazotropha sp. 6PLUC2]
MTRISSLRFILPWLLAVINPAAASSLIQHNLQVELNSDKHYLHVIDQIELADIEQREFLLHDGLNPRSLTPGVAIKRLGSVSGSIPIAAYRLSMPEGQQTITLEYDGVISHQLRRTQESPGKSQERLPGTISSKGAYLDAGVAWYPYFQNSLQTFLMRVSLPEGWLAISQGEGPVIEDYGDQVQISWHETQPQDDIYLVAGPYQLYQHSVDGVEAQVFLSQPDETLAQRYLQATEDYLSLYQKLIGDYPYHKFALVENFWQSGYGMPSFTLLGSRVIRLPFILHTSYPHEILHNWWGNSVYIDFQQGNWSEGLTSYLADHLLAEQRGKGDHYRRNQLQRYNDFIHQQNDFPLNRFRSRHSSASQAVGYGKSLMLFHMLRRHLGDETFIKGLRRFYQNNRFKVAGFQDLQQAFEETAKDDLDDLFEPWLTRTGAPKLALQDVKIEKTAKGYRIKGTLTQIQPSSPFPIEVPILIQQQNSEPTLLRLPMNQRKMPFSVDLSSKPTQLDVDPWFDLFRHLFPEETPPTLSNLFGSESLLILLPADASKIMQQAYRALANRWSDGYPAIEIALDSDIDKLPNDRPVWILGWENRYKTAFLKILDGYPLQHKNGALELNKTSLSIKDHSFALVSRRSTEGKSMAWLGTTSPETLPGLARKLPHYGKYSYLAFHGAAPNNVLKGEWPVTESPLRRSFTEDKILLEAPKPPPLVNITDSIRSKQSHH